MKKVYKIAFLSIFSLGVFLGPVSVVFAQTPTSTATSITTANIFSPSAGDSGQSEDYTDRLQNCVFNHPIDGSGSFAGCFVNAFYYLILYPSGKFAELTGKLLDFFIAYSLDSNSYSQANGDFVNQGWGVVRDIANVAFIFMLLYIAIRHILQLGTSDLKKTLSSLIVAALLINFSLFFSKVIIDAGNILARAFYNNIEVQYDDQPSGEGVKTISQALVSKVNPQAILSSDLFDAGQYNTPGQPAGVMPNGYAFFIMAVASFVNITIGIVFLSTFLLFAARVIGLWFLMIFSPLAFASFALPNNGSFLGQFGWSGWKDNILKLSFMAPVFLFFLFLLIMFLQIVMSAPIMAGNEDAAHKIMKVLIPFIAIIVILRQAKDIAGKMAGEFGKALTGAVGKLVGGTLAVTAGVAGMAIGAGAFAARQTVGKAATRELASGVNQKEVLKMNRLAKAQELRAASLRGDARSAALARAQDYRQRSMEAAKKVSRLKARSEGSFDARRSEFLQKQVFGSQLGKLAGKGIGEVGGASFGGAKLSFDLGKGKDTSAAKQEEAKKKKALEEAKLYQTGAVNEQNLALVGYAARKGINARDEVIEHLDKYAEEIRSDASLTDQERREYFREIRQMRVRAATATTDEHMRQIISGFQRTDAQGNGVVDADGRPVMERGTDAIAKAFAEQTRYAIADVIEAREQNNPVVNFYGLNPRPETKPHYSTVVADQLRKGDKSAGQKTMNEFFNEWQRDNPPDNNQNNNNNNNQNPPPNTP